MIPSLEAVMSKLVQCKGCKHWTRAHKHTGKCAIRQMTIYTFPFGVAPGATTPLITKDTDRCQKGVKSES